MAAKTYGAGGFTLIEVMIVVAIIGILAAIAYPSYLEHVRSSRRSDAQAALTAFANAMERHYTENFTYTAAANGGSDTGPPAVFPTEAPLDGGTKYYDLKINSADDSSFVLRADPKKAQTGDGFLQLESDGTRGWDRDNSGGIDGGEECWEDNCL